MLGNSNNTTAESSVKHCSPWMASFAHQTHVKSGMSSHKLLQFQSILDFISSILWPPVVVNCRPATSCVEVCLLFLLNLPAGSYIYNEVPEEWKKGVNASQLSPRVAMMIWWIWRRESEKGFVKTLHHVCEEGFLTCLWGVSASARVSPGGESQTGKEQSNLQGSRQTSSDSHLHEPLTTVQDAEEERENWSRKQTFGHGIAVGKRACCLRTPHKLHWHMLPESNVKHFGFHSKPSKSMQITLWISLCFGPSPLKTSSE